MDGTNMPNIERPDDHEIHHDPFAGYASNPDKLRAYASYSEETQLHWKQKSEEAIRGFLKNLPEFNSFLDAYAYLADKRHEYATELKQKSDEGRTEYYGSFRNEGDHSRRSITFGDGEQFWKWQKNKIFELTQQLLAPLDAAGVTNHSGHFENELISGIKERVEVEDKPATYYSATIKFPKQDFACEDVIHSDNLAHIELYDFDANKKFNLIRIEYVPVDNRYIAGNYQIANHFYQALFAWKSTDGLNAFLENAAKLAYLIAHLMPVKEGNAAITEWMLRGIAFYKGIKLGHFNHDEGISWDFKALLTPNVKDYVEWFTHHLFDHCEVTSNKQQKEFSFSD